MGIVAGAPLGGLVEHDPNVEYGLARQLIHPLLPWLREVKFNGPLQVTAIKRGGKWHVIEYNIRIGVTSGPMLLRMLANSIGNCFADCAKRKAEPAIRQQTELRLFPYPGRLWLSIHAVAQPASAAGSHWPFGLRRVVERSCR